MAEKNYQDAVQVLKDRFGGRWEGADLDGRGEMTEILRKQLGFSDADARDTLDAMIAAGQLRYHRTSSANSAGEPEIAPPTPSMGTVTGVPIATGVPANSMPATGGLTGVPVSPAMVPAIGYWEIGDTATDADDAPIGRAGQVTPSGL